MSPVDRRLRRLPDRAGLGLVIAWPVLGVLVAVWLHAQQN